MNKYRYFFYDKKDEFVKSETFTCADENEANTKADNVLKKSRGRLTDWLLVPNLPNQ